MDKPQFTYSEVLQLWDECNDKRIAEQTKRIFLEEQVESLQSENTELKRLLTEAQKDRDFYFNNLLQKNDM